MNRYAAPVIVALVVISLVIGYAAFIYFAVFGSLNAGLVVKILIAVGALLVIGAVVAVLIQRIREIQGGKEDDISKY